MNFAFYIEANMDIKVGDKLPLTVAGKAPGLLIYGIDDKNNPDMLNIGPTLYADPHDRNYLAAEKMADMPEDITATVLAVEDIAPGFSEVTIEVEI